MSQPAKEFEADVLDGLVDAGGNPLMEWCIANAVVQTDGKDNIYPIKKKSRGRIDPVIAALIARKLAAMDDDEQPPTIPIWSSHRMSGFRLQLEAGSSKDKTERARRAPRTLP